MQNNKTLGKSHAKIIFMGEHSVVYDEPAIALPISNVNLTASIQPIDAGQLIQSKYFIGELDKMPSNLLGIQRLIRDILKKFHKSNTNFLLKINSQIPSERGMGSSAASAVAITRAMYNYFHYDLNYNKLMQISNIEEKITHGNPSGLDTATAGSNKPVWFIHGKEIIPIPLNITGSLVIADTGIKGRTDIAVNSVRQKINNSDDDKQPIYKLGHLVKKVRKYFKNNDIYKLGVAMNQAQSQLRKLQVSSYELDRLINIALNNGALGAKLTGSGLGGCIIALTKSTKDANYIAKKLLDSGAVNTWIQSFDNGGK